MKAKFINEVLNVGLTDDPYKMMKKYNYDIIQWFIIKQWGTLLYLDYNYFETGPGNYDGVVSIANDYLKHFKNRDEDEIEEYNDWTQEGLDGQLTKDLIDKILSSAQRNTQQKIKLYKYGYVDFDDEYYYDNRWVSTTLKKNSHKHLGNEQIFDIPIGTPIILANGIADRFEVIINTKYIPNPGPPKLKTLQTIYIDYDMHAHDKIPYTIKKPNDGRVIFKKNEILKYKESAYMNTGIDNGEYVPLNWVLNNMQYFSKL